MPWFWWIFYTFLFLKSAVIEKTAGKSSVHCMLLCSCFSKHRYVLHTFCLTYVSLLPCVPLPEKWICGCLLYLKQIFNPQILLKHGKFHIPLQTVNYWYQQMTDTGANSITLQVLGGNSEPVTELIALPKAACTKSRSLWITIGVNK